MNTNNNIYTVVYTSVIVIIVAAVLALTATSLKSKQEANEKAEVISQILTAGKIGDKATWSANGNEGILDFYKQNISASFTINAQGAAVSVLNAEDAQVYTVPQLKAENYNIRDAKDMELPVYIFNNGTVVIPIYGAGLWGPVWGYLGLESDLCTIVGATFDHASETPGLGGKIKDDPAFAAQFEGKNIDFSDTKAFSIVKGGAPAGKTNAIDAISGATMTSNGVDAAITTWIEAYKTYLTTANSEAETEVEPTTEEE